MFETFTFDFVRAALLLSSLTANFTLKSVLILEKRSCFFVLFLQNVLVGWPDLFSLFKKGIVMHSGRLERAKAHKVLLVWNCLLNSRF
jgi:hypothetical protein